MVTLAYYGISVVCVPSHTTHIDQPCDAGINRSIKTTVAKFLQVVLTLGLRVNVSDICAAVVSMLDHLETEEAMESVRKSFKYTGIWPVDYTLVESRLKAEHVATDPIVDQAVSILQPKLSMLYDARQAKEKRDGEVKARKKLKIDTSGVTVLNSKESVVQMKAAEMMAEVSGMDAKTLHTHMVAKLGFTLAEISKGLSKKGEVKYLAAETLKRMCQKKVDDEKHLLEAKFTKVTDTSYYSLE
jgi:hypothetical protein